jgi:hypothetical protein
MNEQSAPLRCPVCSTPLSIRVDVAHRPEPTATTRPVPSAPVAYPTPKPQVTSARPASPTPTRRPPAPPLPPIRSAAPKPRRPRRRLSPQATLLSLGVLLLLAAGVTFLAVTWDSLPVSIQAAIMAFLASVALVGAVPASRHKLSGTAEALAILGCGLLAVDLYGARALGLIPATAIDGLSYAGLSCALVAAINLLMSRFAPKVVTFGLAGVIVGQLRLTLVLSDRVDLRCYSSVYWRRSPSPCSGQRRAPEQYGSPARSARLLSSARSSSPAAAGSSWAWWPITTA